MGQVNVVVNNRSYAVACADGQEGHLTELARYLDRRVQDLHRQIGEVSDSKLLLMAGLLIADELSDSLARIEELETEESSVRANRAMIDGRISEIEGIAADAIENAIRRVEGIAARLAPS